MTKNALFFCCESALWKNKMEFIIIQNLKILFQFVNIFY